MGILTILASLTGCTKHDGNEGTTVIVADGATLTGLYMSHQGMAMEPYYMFRSTADGSFMKISSQTPDSWNMTEGEPEPADTAKSDGLDPKWEAQYFRFIDTVKNCERASLVVPEETVIQELNDAVFASEALTWDGYSVNRSMDGVLDSGDGYGLFLVFSDGSTVRVNSYNSCPKGWSDFFESVRDIFETHADYSKYKIKELSEEKCDRMIVGFSDGSVNPTNEFKIDINVRKDLGTWSWTIRLKDSEGLYLDKGTDISLYREENIDTLDFGRLIDVLRANDVQEWDGTEGTANDEKRFLHVQIADDEDRTITAYGNQIPENYDKVRDEFVRALIEFYEDKK